MYMLVGSGWLLLASLVAGEPSRLHADAFTLPAVSAVLFLTVVGSLIGFSAYGWLLTAAPISLVSTYAYVNPVVAVWLGWLVLDEPVTSRVVLAGSAIVVAVALIASAPRAR
jgi:drug/metabolite transporter (DMT)-like permease